MKLFRNLEKLKCEIIQTASGSVPGPLYTELLAAYLAEGELIRLIPSYLSLLLQYEFVSAMSHFQSQIFMEADPCSKQAGW